MYLFACEVHFPRQEKLDSQKLCSQLNAVLYPAAWHFMANVSFLQAGPQHLPCPLRCLRLSLSLSPPPQFIICHINANFPHPFFGLKNVTFCRKKSATRWKRHIFPGITFDNFAEIPVLTRRNERDADKGEIGLFAAQRGDNGAETFYCFEKGGEEEEGPENCFL